MIVVKCYSSNDRERAFRDVSQNCVLQLMLMNIRHFPSRPIYFINNPSFLHSLMNRIHVNVTNHLPCVVEACLFAEALLVCPVAQYPYFISQVFEVIHTDSIKLFETYGRYIFSVQSVDDKIALLLLQSRLLYFLPTCFQYQYQKVICQEVIQLFMDDSICFQSEMSFCFSPTITHSAIPIAVSLLLEYMCVPAMFLQLGKAKERMDPSFKVKNPMDSFSLKPILQSQLYKNPSTTKKTRASEKTANSIRKIHKLSPKPTPGSNQPSVAPIYFNDTLLQPIPAPAQRPVKRAAPTKPVEEEDEETKRMRTVLLDIMIQTMKKYVQEDVPGSNSPFVSAFTFIKEDTLPIFLCLCVEFSLRYSREYPSMVWCLVAIRLLTENNAPWMLEKMKKETYVVDIMTRLTKVLFRMLACCKRNIHSLSTNDQLIRDMIIHIGKWTEFVTSNFSDTKLGQEMSLLKTNLLNLCGVYRMDSGISNVVEVLFVCLE